jgi:septal ring factor EnvC (AmiA/AmiB activator)
MPSELRQLQVLAGRLASLADAVARLRETQAQAAQAAAARRAAEQLHADLPARPVTVQPSVPPVSRAPWQDTVRAAGPRRGR